MLRAEGALATAAGGGGPGPGAAARLVARVAARPPTTPTSSAPRRPPRATRWCRWPPGSPATSRSWTRPRPAGCTAAPPARTSSTRALMLVADEAHRAALAGWTSAPTPGAAGHAPRVHADGRPHPGPARGPDHVRAQGGRVAGRHRRGRRRSCAKPARLAVQLGGPVGTGVAGPAAARAAARLRGRDRPASRSRGTPTAAASSSWPAALGQAVTAAPRSPPT